MPSYVVIRLIPDAPIDGGTFSTYLKDLTIQVYRANDPGGTLLGEITTVGSGLMLAGVPWSSGSYSALISENLAEATVQDGSGTFGKILVLKNADGIPFGSGVIDPSNNKAFNQDTDVSDIAVQAGSTVTVTVNQDIQQAIVENEAVSFYFTYPPSGVSSIDVNWSTSQPTFSFKLKTNAASSDSRTVQFASANGVAVGMVVTAASGVTAGTTVTAVSNTKITLNKKVTL